MITHVAIRYDKKIYSLPSPMRHCHVIWTMVKICGIKPPINKEQGFLWCNGKFVTRKEAAILAYEFGQISELKDELFSEDLW